MVALNESDLYKWSHHFLGHGFMAYRSVIVVWSGTPDQRVLELVDEILLTGAGLLAIGVCACGLFTTCADGRQPQRGEPWSCEWWKHPENQPEWLRSRQLHDFTAQEIDP
jgi:hypothetical protein